MSPISVRHLIPVLSLCLCAQYSAAFGLPNPGLGRFTSSLAASTLKTTSVTDGTTPSDDAKIVQFGGSALPQEKPDKQIVGGKGLGLQIMSGIGVSVPPGFTLTTPVCQEFQDSGDLSDEMWAAVREAVKRIEKDTGKGYGNPENPLLFSCRSGAAVSMPGMMDTVLNIGLNKETVEGLAKATNNKRFAYDAYRRLLDMFGDVVLGISHEAFERRLEMLKMKKGVRDDTDFSADDLEELCEAYYEVYAENDKSFPEDPFEQLKACVKAVFSSWNADRAIKYREINGIASLLGTACNIQTMVFGNRGETSGTGVAFSRDPGTGENKMKGEYLINAQGEDVVAGIRTPEPIARMKEVLPDAYEQFMSNVDILEKHFKDMQDVEFTVEDGKLWMLQCRSGKRTGQAAFKIAADLVEEGLCTPEEALFKVEPDHVKQVLHPTFSSEALESKEYKDNVVAVGLAGGPGAAIGKLAFTTEDAEARQSEGVILVRENTSPEDVGGMWAANGIVTSRGGVTSHAAVVARGWGKPCVCGCEQLEIDEKSKTMTVKRTGETFTEGDTISVNGNTGEIVRVAIETSSPALDGEFGKVLGWADALSDKCKVMANADSGPDATKAAELGAQGVGLCRTEHMFFAPERLPVVRRWILRGEDLDKVQEFQRTDFREIMAAMDGKPVTIRLLDPPLHEFLPRVQQVDDAMAKELGYSSAAALISDIESMHEENPMLGLRGCRLAIVRPEVATMQAEAIINAAADLIEQNPDAKPFPRIMVPLVGSIPEFVTQAIIIKRTAERIKAERNIDVPYEIGTMIEVPRAALISDQLASVVDPEDGQPLCSFFSFGTNDLTQMTMGISRDDSGAFIPTYLENGILEEDPFKTIDAEGVGWLVRHSSVNGRAASPGLSLSVCGEHGGDPQSIEFFDKVGLDYVSCSPFRVPVARLATGQAAVKRDGGECDVKRL
ncbi:Pyruvate, phosphate dikinase, chloroplastic [Seminavis robusta]|uniref:Pyruvate, phosphate dikinase n=1 Tax=Seminavis robusta TaxID=568900 RepID=A0A9N8EJA5_9STRA|nr:Pyruvate, phosphate dikinase, chloroplastic [Seminavis robusta]|eukprot:Sro1048_g235250.1 Pyruvate, phosphate dikinase, chloroplastic (951) ;mRNA; r:22507-25939